MEIVDKSIFKADSLNLPPVNGVIMIGTEHCPTCKVVEKLFDKVYKESEGLDINMYKVYADGDIIREFKLEGKRLPIVLFYKDSVIVCNKEGFCTETFIKLQFEKLFKE